MIKKKHIHYLILNNHKLFKHNTNKMINVDYLKNKLVVLKDNEIYRYGDFIKNTQTHSVIIELLTNPIYNNTILKKYIEKKKDKFNLKKDINNRNLLLYQVMIEYIKNMTNEDME